MSDKIINATLAGFIGTKGNKEKFSFRYSLSSIYKFIQFTKLPTDVAFEIYEFINPVNCVDLEELKKIIFQVRFLKETGQLEYKFPLEIYEEKFEDSLFTDRFFHLLKKMIIDREIKINYINFKFISNGDVYCLNMKLKTNKKKIRCFSLKFVIKECYQWRGRYCRCKKSHNHRLCKFIH